MGELGAGWIAPTVSIGSSIGGSIAAGAIGGAWGGPIGSAIGIIGGLISSIFGAHAAKVAREDQISSAWAANGPAAISGVMDAYAHGQISGADAVTALDQIEAQFREMTQSITKYRGQFGSFPDPNAPRPGDQCNWACGTSWDLHQQLEQKKAAIAGREGNLPTALGSLTSNPMNLVGLAVLAWVLLK